MSKRAITLATKHTQAQLTRAQAAQVELDALTITNQDDQEFAADVLRDVKAQHKALEAERKKITKPMLEAKAAVDALFKPPREALELAESTLKDKIAGYLASVEERNTAAVEAASKAETAEEASAALSTMQHAEAPTGVSVRYVYDPIVVNEGMVDRMFMSPDMNKIKEWMKLHKNPDGSPKPIPGLKFSPRSIVASRKVAG